MVDLDGVADPSIQLLGTKFKARSYQVEMLQQSLKQNIIIAMPTGSGKTLVAAMRALASLESQANKLVWFCAPKVELAYQQFRYISAQIPSFKSRILSGSDNCEYWSAQIWKDALKDTAIIVSTHAVSFDFPSH